MEEALAAKRLVEQGVTEDEIVQTIHESYRPKAGASAKEIPFPDIPRIRKEELKSMLGNPDIIILDIRSEDQWQVADKRIVRAIHEDPEEYESWADKYPKEKTLILYCA